MSETSSLNTPVDTISQPCLNIRLKSALACLDVDLEAELRKYQLELHPSLALEMNDSEGNQYIDSIIDTTYSAEIRYLQTETSMGNEDPTMNTQDDEEYEAIPPSQPFGKVPIKIQ